MNPNETAPEVTNSETGATEIQISVQMTAPTVEAVTVPEPSAFDQAIQEMAQSNNNQVTAECMEVKIFSEYVETEIAKGVFKRISHGDFKKIITQLSTEVVQEQISGLHLPQNVFFISQASGKIYISCYYPSSVRNLKYNRDTFDIMTPNIIVSHVLRPDSNKDWIVEDSKYFCTDLPISKLPKTFINAVNNSARIWLLPMSNTYDDGKMCYGNNSLPVRFKDNNLRPLDYHYFNFLWDTPFNDDLGIRSAGREFSVHGWYRTLEKVATDKKPFPYSFLRSWTQGEYSSETDVRPHRD